MRVMNDLIDNGIVRKEKQANKNGYLYYVTEAGQDLEGGDFSIIVRPLPKIMLRYIFYLADEDFPASATCLFSSNSLSFLPIDALADTGEYTSKKIIELVA